MFNKIKRKTKKILLQVFLQCFSIEKISIKHKENCLIINGKQTVKSKSGSTEFKNHFKQLAVLFMIYADFESLLKRVKVIIKIMLHTLKNIKIISLLFGL